MKGTFAPVLVLQYEMDRDVIASKRFVRELRVEMEGNSVPFNGTLRREEQAVGTPATLGAVKMLLYGARAANMDRAPQPALSITQCWRPALTEKGDKFASFSVSIHLCQNAEHRDHRRVARSWPGRLVEQSLPNHVCSMPPDRSASSATYIIKGIPREVPAKDIQDEIEEMGYKVEHIERIKVQNKEVSTIKLRLKPNPRNNTFLKTTEEEGFLCPTELQA